MRKEFKSGRNLYDKVIEELMLNFSARQAKTDIFTNIVNPDEKARNETSRPINI